MENWERNLEKMNEDTRRICEERRKLSLQRNNRCSDKPSPSLNKSQKQSLRESRTGSHSRKASREKIEKEKRVKMEKEKREKMEKEKPEKMEKEKRKKMEKDKREKVEKKKSEKVEKKKSEKVEKEKPSNLEKGKPKLRQHRRRGRSRKVRRCLNSKSKGPSNSQDISFSPLALTEAEVPTWQVSSLTISHISSSFIPSVKGTDFEEEVNQPKEMSSIVHPAQDFPQTIKNIVLKPAESAIKKTNEDKIKEQSEIAGVLKSEMVLQVCDVSYHLAQKWNWPNIFKIERMCCPSLNTTLEGMKSLNKFDSLRCEGFTFIKYILNALGVGVTPNWKGKEDYTTDYKVDQFLLPKNENSPAIFQEAWIILQKLRSTPIACSPVQKGCEDLNYRLQMAIVVHGIKIFRTSERDWEIVDSHDQTIKGEGVVLFRGNLARIKGMTVDKISVALDPTTQANVNGLEAEATGQVKLKQGLKSAMFSSDEEYVYIQENQLWKFYMDNRSSCSLVRRTATGIRGILTYLLKPLRLSFSNKVSKELKEEKVERCIKEFEFSTVIVSEHRNHEGKQKSEVIILDMERGEMTEPIGDSLSVAESSVISKDLVLKSLVHQTVRYWEGRGTRKRKMKQKIFAFSYYPP
ncbi:unnamed protein product [Cuscuta epithymum]|uniref:Uncharacterized protein n=1 Tax=Cuscuta epithymum TaxID=186058 RepID=A0AAV0EJV9_9ASTE|nr:unnamed protein product [Cuscuta epithymum]CAH9124055.1 unnamed protein product [Cuscuta epithymum]